jgi:tRNA A-37 threonylcarbamoyl transferase component Bud32
MPIAIGTKLGSYEVLSTLGAGGMGEVYRARDPKLGRDVALKVLQEEIAADRDRLRRFEQEARSASGLNHPNIVTIYDIGTSASTAYIAMEYVEGMTLRDLVLAGPLPTRKLLEIGAQTADGLAKAHGAGIVHRDLKPENLMVTKDGFVKILDFGLAKLAQAASGDFTHVSTIVQETTPGTVLGTVGYMSPEQASGQRLDFRSDQFSLGSILYEMATGRRAFQATTAAQTLAAIIQDDPEPIAKLSPKTPAPLRWIVERCLSKDVEHRYAATKDLARELSTLRDHLSEASSTVELAAPAARARWKRAALVAGLLAAGAGLFFAGEHVKEKPLPTFQRLTFRRGHIHPEYARFAPDPKTIVYSASWDGADPEIFTTRVESPESRPLGITGQDLLSVSPSGELAIQQQTSLAMAVVSLGGGAPRPLLEKVVSADWTPDGKQLAVIRGNQHLELPPGKLLYESKRDIAFVRVSPSGRYVAFVEFEPSGFTVVVMDRQGRKVLTTKPSGWILALAWAPKGDEVWFSAPVAGQYTPFAVTLSGRMRQVASFPVSVVISDISRDGRVLLVRQTVRSQISGLFPGEKQERDLSWLDNPQIADLSADGKTLLFTERGEGAGATDVIYIRKTDGSPAVRLGEGFAESLSPDAKWVLGHPPNRQQPKVLLLPTGAGEARTLSMEPLVEWNGARWFPDSRRFVVSGTENGHKTRCYVVDLETGKPRPLTPEGIRGVWGRAPVSPDGRLLFVRDGREEGEEPSSKSRAAAYSLDGGEVRPLKGWDDTGLDKGFIWSADSRALLGHRHEAGVTKLVRFDVATGSAEVIGQLTFADRAGIVEALDPAEPFITPDGKWYAYSYRRTLSDLFLADGLR